MDAGMVLTAVRERRPVVHCLTNVVTVGRVADALAALGALPVMASAEEEAGAMARQAQALLLNLGTPDAARWRAARAAGEEARGSGVPIVIDPVGCGATPWRTAQARELVSEVGADVVRGNAAEIAALAALPLPSGVAQRGVAVVGGRGDEEEIAAQERLAREAAQALGSVIALTGRTDVVAWGERVVRHWADAPALAGLVGAGDVLSSVIAACCAVESRPSDAALAGLAIFAAAARAAGKNTGGPGTFWPRLMDELHGVEPGAVSSAGGGTSPARTVS